MATTITKQILVLGRTLLDIWIKIMQRPSRNNGYNPYTRDEMVLKRQEEWEENISKNKKIAALKKLIKEKHQQDQDGE
jgi:hypothetical protein